MRQFQLLFAAIFLAIVNLQSQSTFPVNGAPQPLHTLYVFTNCTLHVDANETIINATLFVKDGIIVNVGEHLVSTKDAITVDLKGKHIYPAFIDLYSDYGMPEVKRGDNLDAPKKGAFGWNQAIRSDVEAHRLFLHNQQKADELRKIGFGCVLTAQKDGIVRGSGTLVNLSNAKENESIVKDRAAGFYSFNKGSSPQDYPSSLMGGIALLRQTYYDAAWYASNANNRKEFNISLDAFNKLQELPSIFEGNDKYNDIRGKRVGDEFKVKYIIKGGGNEYQRLYDIQNSFSKYIIPVNFPDAIDVEDPFDAENTSTGELKHWEMAPANLGIMEKNNIQFCITSSDLKDKSLFLKNIRKAVKYGLSEKMALKALTTNPAEFIGVQSKIGALKKGMLANFFICSESVFSDECVIYETWSNGLKHAYVNLSVLNINGNYQLSFGNEVYKMTVLKDNDKYSGTVFLKDSLKAKANIGLKNNMLTLSFPYDSIFTIRLSGNYNENNKSFSGKGQDAKGNWFDFKLTYLSKDSAKAKDKKEDSVITGKVIYPFTAYGTTAEDGLIKDSWPKFKKMMVKY